MRCFLPSLAIGSVLLAGLSGSALIAQDQNAPPAASAQAPVAPPAQRPVHVPNPRHQAKKMAKELGLTPDQVSKIEPILADRDQQVQSVRSDSTLAHKDMRARVHGIRRDSDSKIEAILNDAQKQQYEQIKQSRKANRQQQTGAATNS
jgi:Spy/CpxP family protein refolding chaperone